MEVLTKAAAIALLSAACCLTIKAKNPEISFALTVVCAVCVCFAAVGMLTDIVDFINSVMDKSALPTAVFLPVIKCVGIALITRLISNLCMDAGQNGTSAAIEYLGSAAAVFTALPLMQTMLKTLEGLL